VGADCVAVNRQSIPVNTKRNHSRSNRAEAIGTSAEWNERTESGLTSSDGNENGKITLNKLSRERENIDIGDTLEMTFYGSLSEQTGLGVSMKR